MIQSAYRPGEILYASDVNELMRIAQSNRIMSGDCYKSLFNAPIKHDTNDCPPLGVVEAYDYDENNRLYKTRQITDVALTQLIKGEGDLASFGQQPIWVAIEDSAIDGNGKLIHPNWPHGPKVGEYKLTPGYGNYQVFGRVKELSDGGKAVLAVKSTLLHPQVSQDDIDLPVQSFPSNTLYDIPHSGISEPLGRYDFSFRVTPEIIDISVFSRSLIEVILEIFPVDSDGNIGPHTWGASKLIANIPRIPKDYIPHDVGYTNDWFPTNGIYNYFLDYGKGTGFKWRFTFAPDIIGSLTDTIDIRIKGKSLMRYVGGICKNRVVDTAAY